MEGIAEEVARKAQDFEPQNLSMDAWTWKKVSRSPPFCGPEMQVNPLDPFGAHRSSIGFMGHGPRGGLGLCDAEDHAAGAHAGPEARGHLENPRVAALRQAVWSCG